MMTTTIKVMITAGSGGGTSGRDSALPLPPQLKNPQMPSILRAQFVLLPLVVPRRKRRCERVVGFQFSPLLVFVDRAVRRFTD